MKVLDLFSGIGGFSLGLERAGMETVAFCEYEEYPRRVLAKHWPDVPCYPDVRELTKEQLDSDGISPIDLICGGYPCQPFSHAGKRAGEADDRHLWPEMYRLIETIRPRWVLAENVAGHITMGLDAVLSDLEAANYTCWPFVIPACAVDARHRRDRVWVVGNSKELQRDGGEHHATEGAGQISEPRAAGGEGDVADADDSGRGKQWGTVSIRAQHAPAECSDRWGAEPDVGRVANGVPNRVDRLKCLGNAVVPQVVEVIGRAIMEVSER